MLKSSWIVFVFSLLGIFSLNPATATPYPRTVFVHLFEWKWTDIAQECETFLGPKGFSAVQVSPPNEHRILPNYPWYQRYQPVSYQLESRSGNRAEFIDMVKRCRGAGVDIYVDAVINHMSAILPGETEVGSAGTRFDRYNYPGLYQAEDFHNCNRHGDNDIRNYQDMWEVQTCELVNLADLDTGSPKVQATLAAYLSDLVKIGVAGFRIDASKHIHPGDLQAILSQVQGNPYFYLEVINLGGEPIPMAEYLQIGDITEFKYGLELARVFYEGSLGWLEHFGTAWGFMPSDKGLAFLDNHDNQRGHGAGGRVLTHKQGKLYELASVFMLAWPYGYPQVMSSYEFSDHAQGPPADGNGNTRSVYVNGQPNCFGEWKCEHRLPAIANLVEFRNYTQSRFEVTHWWSDGDDQIAFGRGDRGFVVINRSEQMLQRSFQTGLAPGQYCNVVTGLLTNNGRSCTGEIVTVDGSGIAEIKAMPISGVAIHGGQKIQ